MPHGNRICCSGAFVPCPGRCERSSVAIGLNQRLAVRQLGAYCARLLARAPITVPVDEPAQVLPYMFRIDARPVRFMLPTAMLRMQGGFAFDATHPFVATLDHGVDRLRAFYREFTPANLAQMHGLDETGRRGADLPAWELPWILRGSRSPPPGELGLNAAHGVAFYGPVTHRKSELECTRLRELRRSIERKGYNPDRFGDIHGHFMRGAAGMCFFVRGGKHRAAVLAHLGHQRIGVRIKRHWPRLIDERDAAFWPLVAAGRMDRALAVELFNVYFAGNPGHSWMSGGRSTNIGL